MNIKEKTFRNFTLLIITESFSFVSNLIILFFLTHEYVSEDFVYYSYYSVFSSFLIIFSNFGLNATIIRHLSALQDKDLAEKIKVISGGLKLLIISSFTISLFLLFTSNFFEELYKKPGLGNILIFTSLILFFTNIISYFESIFIGLNKYKFYGISILTLNFLKLLITSLALLIKLPIVSIIELFTLLSFVHIFLIFYMFNTQIKKKEFYLILKNSKKIDLKLLKFSVLIFLPNLFNYLYTQFNQFILVFYVESIEFASYNLTLVIIQLLSIPLIIFIKLTLPLASYYMQKKGEGMKMISLIFNSIVKYGLLIMIPISFYILYFSNYLILLIFNIEYHQISNYLKFFFIYLNILIISAAGGHFLWASNEPKIVLKLSSITALFSIVLSMILIPYFSIYGAITSIIIPHSLYIIYTNYLVKKKFKIKLDFKVLLSIIKYILSALIAVLFVSIIIVLFSINLNNFITLVSISIIYFGLFLILSISFRAIKIIEIKDFINIIKKSSNQK